MRKMRMATLSFVKLALASAMSVMMLSATPLLAQDANPEQPAAAPERKPEDNWLKVCGGEDKKVCVMRQTIGRDGQFAGSFVLRDNPNQNPRYTITTAVPTGVLLPTGMLWQIDSAPGNKANYTICDKTACFATRPVPDSYIESLKKGGKFKMIALNPRRKEVTVEVTLIGFTSVFEGEGIDVETLRKRQSGESTLQQRLNDIAQGISSEGQ